MLRRILALIRKELAALWSDPKTRGVILIPPLVQVMLTEPPVLSASVAESGS